MIYWIWPCLFVLGFSLVSGCEVTRRADRRLLYQPEVADRRRDILERLLPEEKSLSTRQRRALTETTATVMKDVDRDDLRESFSKVRRVLRGASLEDLERIETILPEVSKKYERDE